MEIRLSEWQRQIIKEYLSGEEQATELTEASLNNGAAINQANSYVKGSIDSAHISALVGDLGFAAQFLMLKLNGRLSQTSSSNGNSQLLGFGSRGPAVSDLQQRLKDLGISPGPIDGIFGPLTKAAVMAFQRSQGITVDGICGPQTRAALDAAEKPGGGGVPKTGNPSAAYDIAHEVLGQNISWLKYNGPLAQYLDKWPGNNVCCANFVSACLEKAGEININEHSDGVPGLAYNLRHDKRWSETSLASAQPGDVVCFNVPGEGPMSHVVLFSGWDAKGRPLFIGSNNDNPDGSQRITEHYISYPIGALFHYHG